MRTVDRRRRRSDRGKGEGKRGERGSEDRRQAGGGGQTVARELIRARARAIVARDAGLRIFH